MRGDRISRRRALVWGIWTLVLVTGLVGLFAWHSKRSYDAAIRAFEGSVGSANHDDYLRENVPDDRNAAVAFRNAVPSLDADGAWARMPDPSLWSSQTEAAARESLVRHIHELENLAAAADLESCAWQPEPEVDAESMLALLRASRLARLLGLVGALDVDQERLADSFHILGVLAECAFAQPHLVGAMIGGAVERSRLEVVHAAVSRQGFAPELLQTLEGELRRSAQVDRVAWAIAAEGAFALRLLEESRPNGAWSLRHPLSSVLWMRIATALASRWVDLKAWSGMPLAEMSREPVPKAKAGPIMASIVADILIPNLRDGIMGLRINRALLELALVTLEARRHGARYGTYDGAFEGQPGFSVLSEADGSAVLIDSELESVLRAHSASAGESDTGRSESALDLTVWRLPSPAATGPPGG